MALPSAPSITQAINLGTTISVSWSAVADVDSYTVSLSDASYQPVTVDGLTTTYSFTNLNTGTQLTASVYATNSNGNSSTTTVSVDDIGYGQVLWVDAQDTSTMTFSGSRTIGGSITCPIVTQLNDKSGKGNHLTISPSCTGPIYISNLNSDCVNALNTTPIYSPNGYSSTAPFIALNKPVLLFRGRQLGLRDSYTVNLNSQSSPMTFITVIRDYNDGCSFGTTANTNSFIHYSGSYDGVVLSDGTNLDARVIPKRNYSGLVMNCIYDTIINSSLYVKNRFNGSDLLNTKSTRLVSSFNHGFNNLVINGRTNGETTQLFLCELIIYNRILSTNELQCLEGYLAAKWGIQTSLPISHPYSSTTYPGVITTSVTGVPVTRTAPTLTGNVTVTMTSIQQNVTNPSGITVASILSFLGSAYTPYDSNDSKGIAVVSTDSTSGTWQYSTNSGSSWSSISSVDSTHFLNLSSGTGNLLRFIPTTNYTGSASLTLSAWDTLTGTNGSISTVASTGGSTSYSSGTATLSISVTPAPPTIQSAVSNGVTLDISWSATSTAIQYTVSVSSTILSTSISPVILSSSTTSTSIPYPNDGGKLTVTVVATLPNSSTLSASSVVDDIGYGQVLWIDAQDTTTMTFSGTRTIASNTYSILTQLNDKSGKNNHLTLSPSSTGPIYVPYVNTSFVNDILRSPRYIATSTPLSALNQPALLFRGRNTGSGIRDSLTASLNSQSSPLTIITVIKDFNNGCAFGSTDSSDNYFHYSTYYDVVNMGDGTNSIYVASKSKGSYPGLVINSYYHTTNHATHRLNGTNSTGSGSKSVTGYRNYNNFTINGRSNGETTEFFLCELIIYNRILTTNELNMLEGYLATKWSLQSSLPNTHPYSSTPYTNPIITPALSIPKQAPQLVQNTSVSLTSIQEDTTNPSGDTIASLLSSMGANYTPTSLSDAKGLALYNFSSTGTWQYSLNGTDWISIPILTGLSHLLLTSSAYIRFIPATNYNGSASFSFRAWDTTRGTSGSISSIVSTGGYTPFSNNTGTASLSILSVNDAPTISGSFSFPSMVAASATPQTLSVESICNSFTLTDADVQNAQSVTSIVIVSATSSVGTWYASIDNQATWIDLTSVTPSSAFHFQRTSDDFIKFVPSTPLTIGATSSLTIRAWDKTNSGSIPNSIGDASSGGGTTAYSVNTTLINQSILSSPAVPQNLTASLTGTGILLSWSPPIREGGSTISSYKVYRVSGGTSTLLQTVSGTTTTLTSGITSGTTYSYKVSAVNSSGESDSSNQVSITAYFAPSTITNLKAVAGNQQISLSWNPPSSIGSTSLIQYNIYNSSNILLTTSTTPSVSLYGLTNNQSYSFYVKALNSADLLSNKSSTVKAIPIYTTTTNQRPTQQLTSNVQSIIQASQSTNELNTSIAQVVSAISQASASTSIKTDVTGLILNTALSSVVNAPLSSNISATVSAVKDISSNLSNSSDIQTLVSGTGAAVMSDTITNVTNQTTTTIISSLSNTIKNITTAIATDNTINNYTNNALSGAVTTILTSDSISKETAVTSILTSANTDTVLKPTVIQTLSESIPSQQISLTTDTLTAIKNSIPIEQQSAEFKNSTSLSVFIPNPDYTIYLDSVSFTAPVYLPMQPNIFYTVLYKNTVKTIKYDPIENKLLDQTNTVMSINDVFQLSSGNFKIIQVGSITIKYLGETEEALRSGATSMIRGLSHTERAQRLANKANFYYQQEKAFEQSKQNVTFLPSYTNTDYGSTDIMNTTIGGYEFYEDNRRT